jgi:hypothetical protein
MGVARQVLNACVCAFSRSVTAPRSALVPSHSIYFVPCGAIFGSFDSSDNLNPHRWCILVAAKRRKLELGRGQ